jgi:hypothetical protein
MPRLSVWFVRVALLHLALGFTLGALLLWHKAYPLHPLLWRMLPMHMEVLLVGWTVNLALGVAFWILPRWQSQRGDVRPAWAALALLNAGVWLVALAPYAGAANALTAAGRLLEAAAALAFAVHAWPRVKPWA